MNMFLACLVHCWHLGENSQLNVEVMRSLVTIGHALARDRPRRLPWARCRDLHSGEVVTGARQARSVARQFVEPRAEADCSTFRVWVDRELPAPACGASGGAVRRLRRHLVEKGLNGRLRPQALD